MIFEGFANIIKARGHDVTYKSASVSSPNASTLKKTITYTDYTVKAHIKDAKYSAEDGSVSTNLRECRISPKDLTVTPKENDLIVDDGFTYKVFNVNIHRIKGVRVAYILKIQGNADTK